MSNSFSQPFVAYIYPTAKEAEEALNKALEIVCGCKSKEELNSNKEKEKIRIETYKACSILIIDIQESGVDTKTGFSLGIALNYILSQSLPPPQCQQLADLHTETIRLQEQVTEEIMGRKDFYSHMVCCESQYKSDLAKVNTEVQRRLKLVSNKTETNPLENDREEQLALRRKRLQKEIAFYNHEKSSYESLYSSQKDRINNDIDTFFKLHSAKVVDIP